MICNLCSSFLNQCTSNYEKLYSKLVDGLELIDPNGLVDNIPHHPNYETLRTSAQNGCHVCVFLQLAIDRGNTHDLTRYVVDAGEALLPIKLSQWHQGEWHYNVDGEFIHIKVPCGPTVAAMAEPSPRVIAHQLHHRCSKPSLLTTQEETFTMLSRWLSYCRESHPKCLKVGLHPLPTRVVDVKDDGSEPSLLITNGQRSQYVALSHCWGSSPTLSTTTENLQKHLVHISMDELPRNFRDAVTVTRRLGFRYLWIDSLCIIQDSELDWLRESERMGTVYANASCTIAASSAASSCCGFLLPKNPLEISGYEWTVRPSSLPDERPQRWHIDSPAPVTYQWGGFEKGIRSVPLHCRAWTLQERILSARVIHFVQNQVLWECSTHAAAEFDYIQAETLRGTSLGFTRYESGGHYGQGNSHIVSENFLSKSPSYLDWYDIVMDYTSRHLTYRRDRLPAIWALAQDIQIRSGGTYIAGLFREDLIYGMLFRRTAPSPRSVNPLDDAPSWSWASLETPVAWTSFISKFEPVAEVIAVQVVEKELERSMGRTLRAEIRLSAYLGSVVSVSPSTIPFPSATFPQRLIIDDDNPEEPVGSIWFDYELEDFEKPVEALCIQLGHRPPTGIDALGILVAPTGRAENEYKRVGYYERYFDYHKPGTRLIDKAEKQIFIMI